ncbi:UNVERIFIED_CONTAM: hypothetical protein RMT77_000764 [Armadillidium vulgare]
MKTTLSLLFYFLSSSLAVRTPSISYISKSKEVVIGSSVELECSVQFAQDFPVLWVKKGVKGQDDLPISTNSALIIRDSRYSLRYDKGSSTFILQIKDIQEYDGGKYMCQVIIDMSNRISSSINILVLQPPIIFDNSTRTIVEPMGTPVKLECYATGIPTPKVSWRRENNALLPTGGSVFSGNQLLIPSIRKEDRGTYYCIAENGVGQGARRNINVEVEFKPVITALKPIVKQARTFDALLECRVESYPPADIDWVHRSEAIVTSNNYRISQFAADDEFTDSVLTVIGVERRQYGNYTCRANNKLGVTMAHVLLEESYSPVCPPACELPYTYAGEKGVRPEFGLLLVLLWFAFV